MGMGRPSMLYAGGTLGCAVVDERWVNMMLL